MQGRLTGNLLDRVPAHAQDLVGSLVRSIFNHQLPAKEVWSQHARVVAKLESSFPDAAAMLDDAADDILAFTAYPRRRGGGSGPTTPRSA